MMALFWSRLGPRVEPWDARNPAPHVFANSALMGWETKFNHAPCLGLLSDGLHGIFPASFAALRFPEGVSL